MGPKQPTNIKKRLFEEDEKPDSSSKKSSSSSSALSSSSSSSSLAASDLVAGLFKKRECPPPSVGSAGGKKVPLAVSKTSPGPKKKRITRFYVVLVVDADSDMLLAVFVSNAYDRARFLTGECNLDGEEDGEDMVKFPMRLLYANTRRNM